jgi:uncharacterized protein YjbJ (UPF0337 family)
LDGLKDEAAGKTKEVYGKVTGDAETEAEGKAQGLIGKAKEKLGDVKDAASDLVEDVKEKFDK